MIKISDKLRSSFPISVTFATGEMPTSTKLNGLSSGTKRGFGLLEYAIGDLWNQGGDALLSTIDDAALMIPSVARYLGAPREINPRIPSLPNIVEYTHEFTAAEIAIDAYSVRLPFLPASGSTYTWGGGCTFDATPVASPSDVIATGDWYVNEDTGTILTFDPLVAGYYLIYEPDVPGDIGDDATWNMIPDPDTSTSYNFRGIKLEYKNLADSSEGYNVYLPPRMPLYARVIDRGPVEHSNNFSTSPTTEYKFWQSHSSAAPTAENYASHYRYNLPTLLTANWSQAANIPAGLLYLYDPTGSGTIIEGLAFAAEDAAAPSTWKLVVTGDNLDTWLSTTQGQAAYPSASLQSALHTATYYPNTGLRLITIGTSIAAALSSLYSQFLQHDHSGPGSLVGKQVKHSELSGLYEKKPLGALSFDKSQFACDDHLQYLHRYSGGYRDRYHNGMLTDIFMNSTSGATNYSNTIGYSNSIIFGDYTNGPRIRFNPNSHLVGSATYGSMLEVTFPYSGVSGLKISRGSNYFFLAPTNTGGAGNNNTNFIASYSTDASTGGFIFYQNQGRMTFINQGGYTEFQSNAHIQIGYLPTLRTATDGTITIGRKSGMTGYGRGVHILAGLGTLDAGVYGQSKNQIRLECGDDIYILGDRNLYIYSGQGGSVGSMLIAAGANGIITMSAAGTGSIAINSGTTLTLYGLTNTYLISATGVVSIYSYSSTTIQSSNGSIYLYPSSIGDIYHTTKYNASIATVMIPMASYSRGAAGYSNNVGDGWCYDFAQAGWVTTYNGISYLPLYIETFPEGMQITAIYFWYRCTGSAIVTIGVSKMTHSTIAVPVILGLGSFYSSIADGTWRLATVDISSSNTFSHVNNIIQVIVSATNGGGGDVYGRCDIRPCAVLYGSYNHVAAFPTH